MVPFLLLTALLFPRLCRCDFAYADFSNLAGLALNGAAASSACDGGGGSYSALRGADDAPATPAATSVETSAGSAGVLLVRSVAASSRNGSGALGTFPQRAGGWAPAPAAPCSERLRLTPAAPGTAGSVMRLEGLPVLGGFEADFTFVISGPSRACVSVKDRALGVASYASCAVAGGDGLAFVVHGDDAGAAALGEGGGGLGYAGLRNALVVELDAWYNPPARGAVPGGGGSGGGGGGPTTVLEPDLLYDHVAVQASPRAGGGVGAGAEHRLGAAARAPVADGRPHRVRVVYEPRLRYDLLPRFTGSAPLLAQFLLDAGAGRRVGTLAVYYDNASLPLIAMPLNLNAVLQLPENAATLGFTAATGAAWQIHDVLEWRFCEGLCAAA